MAKGVLDGHGAERKRGPFWKCVVGCVCARVVQDLSVLLSQRSVQGRTGSKAQHFFLIGDSRHISPVPSLRPSLSISQHGQT